MQNGGLLRADKIKKDIIHAKGYDIGIYTTDYENEFISITDIAKYKSDAPNDVIKNWMRNRETLEFLGLWESLHNPDFKPVEFDGFRSEAGLHAFTMSPTKWIDSVREGRWNGGFAPYGYKLVNGELHIAEDEAEIIRIIFDKYIHTNMGVNSVAD